MAFEIEKDWTTAAGMRAVIVRMLPGPSSFSNHRCGYVAVPPGNPCYGKSYSTELDAQFQPLADAATLGSKSPVLMLTAMAVGEDRIQRSPELLIDVHGGITFGRGNTEGDYPVDHKDVTFFGFDCAHYQDNHEAGGQSLEYCVTECERMATQFAALQVPAGLLLTNSEAKPE